MPPVTPFPAELWSEVVLDQKWLEAHEGHPNHENFLALLQFLSRLRAADPAAQVKCFVSLGPVLSGIQRSDFANDNCAIGKFVRGLVTVFSHNQLHAYQRTIATALHGLPQVHPILQFARAVFSDFLRSRFSCAAACGGEFASNVAILECIIDMPKPVFASEIEQAIPWLLGFLSQALQHELSAGPAASADGLRHSLRVVLQFVHKFRAAITTYMTEEAAALQLIFGALTQTLRSSAVVNEAMKTAALTYVRLVSCTSTNNLWCSLMEAEHSWFESLSKPGKAAICYAMVNINEEPLFSVVRPGELLFDAVYPALFEHGSSMDLDAKFIASQAFEVLVRRTLSCFQSSLAEGVEIILPGGDSLRVFLRQSLEFLWTLWDDPGQPILGQLRDLIDCILGINSAAEQLAHRTAGCFVALDITELLKEVSGFPSHQRSKYPTLLALLPIVGPAKIVNQCPRLIEGCTENLTSSNTPIVTQFLRSLFAARVAIEGTEAPWVTDILETITRSLIVGESRVVALCGITTVFFPALGENALHIIQNWIESICQKHEREVSLFGTVVHLLRSAKAAGTIETLSDLEPEFIKAVAQPIVRVALQCNTAVLRLATADLVATCAKPSKQPSQAECELMSEFLQLNPRCTDPAFRAEYIPNVKRWLTRLTTCIHRDGNGPAAKHLEWFCAFARQALITGGSLDRLYTAVLLCNELISTTRGYEFDSTVVNCLILFLLRGSDRLRTATHHLLLSAPCPLPGYDCPAAVHRLASVALKLLSSNSLKGCDAGACIWRLLNLKYNINMNWDFTFDPICLAVQIFPQSLLNPAPVDSQVGQERHIKLFCAFVDILERLSADCKLPKFPALHGSLQVLRLLFIDTRFDVLGASKSLITEEKTRKVNRKKQLTSEKESGNNSLLQLWAAAIQRLISLVDTLCREAIRVLAIDMGDAVGCLHEGDEADGDSDDDAEDGSADTRPLVVRCWRAVKEGCLLLAAIAQQAPLGPVLAAHQIKALGELLMHIALTTKHNGAIFKASEAVHVMSRRLITATNDLQFSRYPSQWLRSLLTDSGVLSGDSNRILRRSAGLPRVTVAILTAEDKGAPVLLRLALDSLIEVATTDEDSLCRVNALNVLKYILEDSLLAGSVQPFVGVCLRLALAGFSHAIWAVRNSSMMLFSVAAHRAVGGPNRNRSLSVREFSVRFPDVVSDMIQYLQQGLASEEMRPHPCIYPTLQIISMCAPQTGETDNPALLQLKDLVSACRTLRQHLSRSVASKAFSCLIPNGEIGQVAENLLSTFGTERNNDIHGALSQIQALLPNAASADLETILAHLAVHSQSFLRLSNVAVAAAFQVACSIITTLGSTPGVLASLPRFTDITAVILERATHKISPLSVVGHVELITATLKLHLSCLVLEESDAIVSLVLKYLFVPFMAATILDFLLQKNSTTSRLLGLCEVQSALWQSLSQISPQTTEINSVQVLELGLQVASLIVQNHATQRPGLWAPFLLKVVMESRNVNIQHRAMECLCFEVTPGGDVEKVYIQTLDAFSRPDQPIEVRSAAVDILRVSKVLGNTHQENLQSPGRACFILHHCLAAHRLLHDEAEAIRNATAALIEVPTTRFGGTPQVEVVLRHLHQLQREVALGEQRGNPKDLSQAIVLLAQELCWELLAGLDALEVGDAFSPTDMDETEYFIDPFLRIEAAAENLAQLIVALLPLADSIWDCLSEPIRVAAGASKWLHRMLDDTETNFEVGGVTFHPDFFLAFHRVMSLFRVLTPVSAEAAAQLAGLQELLRRRAVHETIHPILL
eukprot:TRINITY_DN15298_c0_g1_i1.p1 TRINITY_DN15298_c0_g1~~TRINITY_DN15298_c0_g1_i1.p1  ORF type:complete len:1802 (+),score=244.26 TRINITY_DN15298_c0_g1_i1:37-5406(+)